MRNSAGRRHSSVEVAFLWLGSWRPTSAIVLVYSIMGIQINKETQRPVPNSNPPQQSVSLLSEKQLSQLNFLQSHTRRAETDLSETLAAMQVSSSGILVMPSLVISSPIL